MKATSRPSTPDHNVDDLDLADPAGVACFVRNRLAPLSNALQVIRRSAGNDLCNAPALDVADRQVKALAALATKFRGQG